MFEPKLEMDMYGHPDGFLPGIAMDMRMATLTGMSGVVLGWQYSVVIWFRLVTTTHRILSCM